MLKFNGLVIWRLGSRAIIRKYSSPSATVFKTEKLDSSKGIGDKNITSPETNSRDNPSMLQ